MAKIRLKTDRPTHTADFIKSDTERAVFLGNPALDNMMSSLIALGTEVWSTKRRMNVLEALLEEKGVTPQMIEEFVPSAEQVAKWEKERDGFIDLTYSPLLREGDLPVSTPYPSDSK
jgi:hypothetical protein